MQNPDSLTAISHVPAQGEDVRPVDGPRSRRKLFAREARAAMPRRISLMLGTFTVLVLLTAAAGLQDYWRNFAQNTAADLSGALFFAYVIVPVGQWLLRDAHAQEDVGHTAIAATAERVSEVDVHRTPVRGLVQKPRPWPHRVGHVPPRVQSHQHRVQSDRLAQVVADNGATVLNQTILTGMGGVGKTQIAADYARTAWDSGELDVLVWITASSRGALVSGLAQAGVEVCRADPEDAEQAAATFLAWLAPAPPPDPDSPAAARGCRWMIVLDDVADPDDLRGLWPPASPRGRTLVTTRRRDVALAGANRSTIDVGTYDRAEALNYLNDVLAARGRVEPAEQLTALAADLGHLPLALAQAAAYIADSQVSCAHYRALLADRTRTLRDAAPDRLPDEQTLTVAATWSLSVDHADTLRPAGLARPMLQLASLLDANGIPDGVLTSDPIRAYLYQRLGRSAIPHPRRPEPNTVSAQDAHLALTALHRLSLVDYSPSTTSAAVRVHVLVQRATRDSLEPNQIAVAAQAAADALIALWPQQEPDTELPQALRANTAALIRCGGTALLEPDIHPVLVRVGASLSEAGSVEAAIRHFTRLLKHASRHLGDEKASVLAVRRHLAVQHGQHGDVDRAIDEMQQLVKDQLRLLGPDHPETLASRHDLIWWQWSAGDRDGAERDLTVLLHDRLRVQGPDHPDTLETRHNLYFTWAEAGQNREALAAYEDLLRDRIRLHGPDSVHTLAARHQIAGLRERIGDDVDDTLRVATEVVDDRTRLQGLSHPDTITARQLLARLHGEAGDAKAAVETLEVLHEDRVRVQGADHPDTMATRRLLAHWTAETGSPQAALAMLEDLLDRNLRVLGPTNPGTLETRHEIYVLWAETGRLADARVALEGLLSDRCRVQGANHYDTQRTRQALADISARR